MRPAPDPDSLRPGVLGQRGGGREGERASRRDPPGASRGWWRRELAPILVLAGLGADYLSPAALWTILLPLASVIGLASLRRWAAAAAVIVLSSWVFIPTAARAVCAFDGARGVHRVFAVEEAGLPGIAPHEYERCFARTFSLSTLRAGPGFVIEPNRYLKRVFWSFAELHNALAIEEALRDGFYRCRLPPALSDPIPRLTPAQ